MTLKSQSTGYFHLKDRAVSTVQQLNKIFQQNSITSENITKIMNYGEEIIVIWDDGKRPI